MLTHLPTPSTFPIPLLPAHPLICSTRDIAGCVQNISQNQPVHPVAMYRKQRKFGVAEVWRIWQIDKICQTFVRQLTTRP